MNRFAMALMSIWLFCGWGAAHAQTSLVPVAPSYSFADPSLSGSSFSTVSISGQTFTSATRAVIATTTENLYSAQMSWATNAAIAQNHRLILEFWVRKVAPNDGNVIRANVVFEDTGAPYDKSLFTKFPCSSTSWVKYRIPFTAKRNYAAGDGSVRFQIAHGPQTLEIGGVKLFDLGTGALPTGTPVLPANPTANGNTGYGSTAATVSVTGQPFTQAIRITTTQTPPNIWDSQIGWTNTAAIAQNDLLFLTFYARRVSPLNGTGIQAQVVFEENGGNYTHSLTANFPEETGAWRYFAIPFRAAIAYPVGSGALRFQYGSGPQTFEIAAISLQKYPSATDISLFPTSNYYPGSADNAAWRTSAATRIDNLRRRDMTVTVQTATGQKIANAAVDVQMTRPGYRWGSAVVAGRLVGTNADDIQYQGMAGSLFTTSVLENDLKWPFWEDWASWNRAATLNAIQWLQDRRIPIRGHNLIWPSFRNMPNNTSGLGASALRTRIDGHFADILGVVGGDCYQWDVINEPLDNFDVQGRISGVTGVTPSAGILGNAEMIHWFQYAHSLDPAATLFVNDYNVLEGSDASTIHGDYEYALMQWLLQNGAPVTGFGYQAHFGARVTPIGALESTLARFSALPVKFAVTEFDLDMIDQTLQAKYTRDFMTLMFSTERNDDFLMWGFWEGAHWLPNGAMFTQDWTLKPNALAYIDQIFGQWWTNARGTTSANGTYALRGYQGTYNVTAHWSGQHVTVPVTLNDSGGITVTLANPTVSGNLTFQGIDAAASAQSVTFTIRPTAGGTAIVRTLTVPATGAFILSDIPPAAYTLHVKADKYLAVNVALDTTRGNSSGIAATLPAGDGNNDNAADINDLLLLIAHYNQVSPNANYSANADFNGDGRNDITDLLLLIGNYNRRGDN